MKWYLVNRGTASLLEYWFRQKLPHNFGWVSRRIVIVDLSLAWFSLLQPFVIILVLLYSELHFFYHGKKQDNCDNLYYFQGHNHVSLPAVIFFTFILKMTTAMFVETLVNNKHSMRLSHESHNSTLMTHFFCWLIGIQDDCHFWQKNCKKMMEPLQTSCLAYCCTAKHHSHVQLWSPSFYCGKILSDTIKSKHTKTQWWSMSS